MYVFNKKTELDSVRDKINIPPDSSFVKPNHNKNSRFFFENVHFTSFRHIPATLVSRKPIRHDSFFSVLRLKSFRMKVY